MSTPIAQPAKREHVEEQSAADLAQAAISAASQVAREVTSPAAAAAIQQTLAQKIPGLDPQDFTRDHRIHVKHGSLFIDPYLVLHPRELAPENETKLREKLRLTYTVNNPSFYESYDRLMIALNLGRLIPPTVAARESRLFVEQQKIEAQKQTGENDTKKLYEARLHPFEAMLRETLEKPQQDPVGVEALKNGLSIYLLMREKLTKRGYLGNLSSYVPRYYTPDQVLGELAEKLGVTPLAVREVALKGGVEGVGKLLGIDPAYVADVRKIVEHSATRDFGFNLIEHWHLGRQLLGVAAPMEQKIAHGLEARITANIEDFRRRAKHSYDVPEGVKTEEKRIAQSLNLLEPIQRMLMHKLGYEICYTPEFMADEIAGYPGIYGLHRKAASDLRDTRATYRIYFSGRNDLKGSERTLVHEVAHNLWPDQFTPEEAKKIDALAASDAQRFTALHRLMTEKFGEFSEFLTRYQKAGSDAERAAIVQTTKQQFAAYGVSIDEGVLPYLRDANEFKYLVDYAYTRLSIEGGFYAKSGYERPTERMREIISRFAELKQVELAGSPQLLQFLAPGLNQTWETQYIPHLKKLYHQLTVPAQQMASAPAPVSSPHHVAACAAEPRPSPRIAADSIHEFGPALRTLEAMGISQAMC